MIFKLSMKLYFLLSIIAFLIKNFVQAKDKPTLDVENDIDDGEKTGNDDYFLVIVDHEIQKKKSHEKRQEKQEILDILLSDINNLIIDNRDTYDDPSELEKIASVTNPIYLRKREVEKEVEDESNYAHVISTIEKQSVIFTYLSEDLVPLVEELPNVKAVVHDVKINLDSRSNDELKRLKNTNAWNNPCVKGNTYNYLSIISQDKYIDSKKNASYDKNYYYPKSAGKGTNIFVLDTGFNFTHPEFSNKDEREAKCLVSTSSSEVFPEEEEGCYFFDETYHGNAVADIAGGLTNGIAFKANIYGIAIYRSKNVYDTYSSSIITALSYINDNYLNITNSEYYDKYRYKTVVNLSSSYYLNCSNTEKLNDYLYDLIDDMNNKGVVFVVSASNYNTTSDNKYFPCSFDNVICVGSIDNLGINKDYLEMKKNEDEDYDKAHEINEKVIKEHLESKDMSTKNYVRAAYSNYGKSVDFYAPGTVKAFYRNENGKDFEYYDQGTSYAAPIVAGIAATIMGEFPYYNFNTKRMREHLTKIGVKNVIKGIEKGYPNILINNGKHLNYPQYNKYNTCGINEDLCSTDNELECFSHGCCLKN